MVYSRNSRRRNNPIARLSDRICPADTAKTFLKPRAPDLGDMLLSRQASSHKFAPPCCHQTPSTAHRQQLAAQHHAHRSGVTQTQRAGQICVPRAVAEAPEAIVLPDETDAIEVRVSKEDLGDGVVRLHVTVPQRCVSELWDNAVAAKESKKKSSVPPKKQVRVPQIQLLCMQ